MKVPGDRLTTRVLIKLQSSNPNGSESKYLEQGAYVKVIDPYWLPRGFDVPFSRTSEQVVFSQYGMGVIPKGTTEKERG